METSVFLAKIFGPTFVLIGLGITLNQKYYRKMTESYKKEPALLYMAGLMTFIAGLAVVLHHNVWSTDWRLAITVLGWMILLKGVLLVVAPKYAVALAKLHAHDKAFLWAGLLILLLGLALSDIGFNTYVYTLTT